jgi:hypothetical protein
MCEPSVVPQKSHAREKPVELEGTEELEIVGKNLVRNKIEMVDFASSESRGSASRSEERQSAP